VTTPDNPAREKAFGAIIAKLHGMQEMTPAEAKAAIADVARSMKTLNAAYPQPHATFEDFMAHMLHALKVVGPDHVGVGADWDGGGGVTGMEDCAANWKITARLVKEGYREEDLRKIWGGNALRVLQAAHDARAKPTAPGTPAGGGE
jgi:membrane dipeptidase